jgi:AcrR family transcriptional regulator
MSPDTSADTPARETDGRERIIHHASRLFAARGYDGVSMRQVAEASGMTKAALYYHFPSKKALYLSAVQALLQRVLLSLEDAAQEGPWEERLASSAATMADAIASWGVDLMTLIRDLARFSPGEGSWREQVGDAVLAPVVSAIDDGIEAGALADHDPLWLAWMLAAMVTVAARPLVGEPNPHLVQLALEVFLEGLRVTDDE